MSASSPGNRQDHDDRGRQHAAQGCLPANRGATTEKVGAKVSIANFTFTPAEITIAAGESITWTNDDGAPHGLAYEDGAKVRISCCRELALAVDLIGPAPTITVVRCIPI